MDRGDTENPIFLLPIRSSFPLQSSISITRLSVRLKAEERDSAVEPTKPVQIGVANITSEERFCVGLRACAIMQVYLTVSPRRQVCHEWIE